VANIYLEVLIKKFQKISKYNKYTTLKKPKI